MSSPHLLYPKHRRTRSRPLVTAAAALSPAAIASAPSPSAAAVAAQHKLKQNAAPPTFSADRYKAIRFSISAATAHIASMHPSAVGAAGVVADLTATTSAVFPSSAVQSKAASSAKGIVPSLVVSGASPLAAGAAAKGSPRSASHASYGLHWTDSWIGAAHKIRVCADTALVNQMLSLLRALRLNAPAASTSGMSSAEKVHHVSFCLHVFT